MFPESYSDKPACLRKSAIYPADYYVDVALYGRAYWNPAQGTRVCMCIANDWENDGPECTTGNINMQKTIARNNVEGDRG